MAQPKELDWSANPRAFFGSEVRRLRTGAGLSQERLGALIYVSGTYIGQIEATTRTPQDEELAQRLDTALGADGHLIRVFQLAKRGTNYADYFAAFVDLEKTATRIELYSDHLVPGLLQTPAYSREIFRAAAKYRTDEKIEELVLARADRARILDDPTSLQLWVILDESVLRRTVGGPAVMREQLLHIAALARLRHVNVQVLPYSAGAHSLMEGPIVIMSFAESPTVAYVEGPYVGQIHDDPDTVNACRMSYDHGRAVALPPEASLSMIESAAEELHP